MANVIKETGLMTAVEFLVAKNLPRHCELVQGKVIETNQPSKLLGHACANVVSLLQVHCRPQAAKHASVPALRIGYHLDRR